MITNKIVIVGYGPAGWSASLYAQVACPQAKIIVFEKRPYAIYHPCIIPEIIAGVLPKDKLISKTAFKVGNIVLYTGTEVEEIDIKNKIVYGRRIKTGEKVSEEYDSLIIATGSIPLVPSSISISSMENVFTVKFPEDVDPIIAALRGSSRAVVIGGGALGIEIAYALAKRSIKTSLIEYYPQLMPRKLDKDFSRYIENFLRARKIELYLGEKVEAIEDKVGRKRVITSKRVIEADFVVLATGFKPNTFLAEKAGISLGEKGGIKVDDYMRTTCDEVFAAGDVAEIKSFLTKRPILNFFASSALLTGRIAGLNAAGFREKYVGCFHVWIVKLEDIVFGGVGLSVSEARKEGIEVFSVTAVVPDKPNYYTDLSKLRIKVVINADTKEIVGFQIMSRRRVLELLNLGSWLIYKKTTIRELEKIETAYTPSLCELVHPFSILARITRRKLKF